MKITFPHRSTEEIDIPDDSDLIKLVSNLSLLNIKHTVSRVEIGFVVRIFTNHQISEHEEARFVGNGDYVRVAFYKDFTLMKYPQI
jgi:hypothetical protein